MTSEYSLFSMTMTTTCENRRRAVACGEAEARLDGSRRATDLRAGGVAGAEQATARRAAAATRPRVLGDAGILADVQTRRVFTIGRRCSRQGRLARGSAYPRSPPGERKEGRLSEIERLKEQIQRVEEEHLALSAKYSGLREALLQIIVECDNPDPHGDTNMAIKQVALTAIEDADQTFPPNLSGAS